MKDVLLYMEGKLKEALFQFENIIRTDSTGRTAKKYAGIVSLLARPYDQAIDYFMQLES